MATAVSQRQSNDFFIQGPIMARGNSVAEAICALYYLPKRYKLVLPAVSSDDSGFFDEMSRLVKRMALGARVRFSELDEPDAIIVSSTTPTDLRDEHLVSGGTPEALASAILRVGRITL